MGDDFEEVSRLGDAHRKSALGARIERERRVQTRSRRVRRTCRYVLVISMLGTIGLLFLGLGIGSDLIAGLSCPAFLPALIAGTILFFMGGLAPVRVREQLTDRERDLLDN